MGYLSPDSSQFLDEDPLTDGYYKIGLEDVNGNSALSNPYMVQLTDTIPPDIPTGLSGTIDKNGVVSLELDANQEEDIYGYRLMRSDHPDGDFMQIASRVIRDTTFYDYINLKDLNRYVYYLTLSVDNRHSTLVLKLGFYSHHTSMDGGIPQVISDAISDRVFTSYYLLFGREMDWEGRLKMVWVEVELPHTADFCFLGG
ncbi:MAG: hypothetical protein EA411_12085 [Saprospirales bacterium]|nr:MAG: hypothetical protein EA411_12085 [Saprospirales bacterium]